MNGIIVIDKPKDWTSHDVVAKLRGTLKIKRIGHGGTLDPMATGVLPVFVGKATRAADFITNADKEYIAGLRFGISTDTQDITGEITSACDRVVSTAEVLAVLPRFLGAQKQIPPMYSALRHNGKKLYELARKGIEVERPPRDILISAIELLEPVDNDFILRVACSKGTYIRTLCHDIGAALGCGGVLSSLRRTAAGRFDITMAHTLDSVLETISSAKASEIMLPLDACFSEYPTITLTEIQSHKCKNGARCETDAITEGTYRVYDSSGEFFMLAKVVNGEIKTIKRF